jgi:betaine-aldehyde dehydrogenase
VLRADKLSQEPQSASGQIFSPSAALPTNRGLYYGGGWHVALSGKRVEVFAPATGESLGVVDIAGAEDVDAAVAAARKGFAVWRKTAPTERANALRRAADAIEAHARDLALVDALDCGSPVSALLKDAEIASGTLRYFAGLVLELKGYTMPDAPHGFNFTRREPLGVIARLSAYNHPFMFAAARIAAPLAAGNAVIVKSPDQAPLSTLLLADILGPLFPPGVVNFLSGGRDCGSALVDHEGVDKISLIGSVASGKAILAAAAKRLAKVSLELGGKNALIAYADADPEEVATGAIKGMNFAWCGQSCGSTSRLLLHQDIHDAVVDALVDKLSAFVPGPPTDFATTMGSMIDGNQLERVSGFVERAKAEGARVATGGSRPDDSELARGAYYLPTLLVDVTPDMEVARTEIFGPVLSVLKWRDEDEMFAIANGLKLGLTAAIWTRDLATALQAVDRIEAGFVWVNNSASHFLGSPFGGYKQSGMGREESIEELFDCTQIKHVNIFLPERSV